jgi:filamentous hemagglutinin family protein
MKPSVLFLLFSLFCSISASPLAQDEFFEDEPAPFSLTTKVMEGDASFSNANSEFQITASDGAVIRYDSGFDIPAGETVRFIQPSVDATVINEIIQQTPSQIEGNIFANGKVVLLNSSGIVFGKDSVVEVGKLHAIAGEYSSDTILASLFDVLYDLTTDVISGDVINKGTIKAGEVILAGSSVTNSGTIMVDEGTLVLAGGASVGWTNNEGSLLVTLLSQNLQGGASDIAGQAILQSGIIQASKAQFHGDTITHSGTTQANSVQVGNYSNFSDSNEYLGTSGSLVANELSIAGGLSPSSNPSFELSGKNNQVSSLLITGTHQDITVRSSTTLTVGEAVDLDDQTNDSTRYATNFDLRVENGDLVINYLLYSYINEGESSVSSVLLATEKDLIFNNYGGQFNNYIYFSRNLIRTWSERDGDKVDSRLDGSSISIDDLSFNLLTMNENQDLLPSTWFDTLLKNNPNDEGLDMLFMQPGWPVYLDIQAPAFVDLNAELEEAGGSSALFGGSFAVVASAGGGGVARAGTPSVSAGGAGDSSESGGESEGDGEGDGDSQGGGSASKSTSSSRAQMRQVGVAPFAPISQPILSVEASQVLEKALAPEVEQKMQQYLNP